MADTAHPPILVVDDNPDNAHIIRDYLEARGFPITVAYNGDDALKAFEEVKPSLVLLDVMMPGRDGWQVCRDIKQHPTRSEEHTSELQSLRHLVCRLLLE